LKEKNKRKALTSGRTASEIVVKPLSKKSVMRTSFIPKSIDAVAISSENAGAGASAGVGVGVACGDGGVVGENAAVAVAFAGGVVVVVSCGAGVLYSLGQCLYLFASSGQSALCKI
jgi:hypothetical protein